MRQSQGGNKKKRNIDRKPLEKNIDLGSRRLEALQRAQAQCQTLRATSDANKSSDWAIISLLFDTQVCQCVLTYCQKVSNVIRRKSVVRWNIMTYRKHCEHTDLR